MLKVAWTTRQKSSNNKTEHGYFDKATKNSYFFCGYLAILTNQNVIQQNKFLSVSHNFKNDMVKRSFV